VIDLAEFLYHAIVYVIDFVKEPEWSLRTAGHLGVIFFCLIVFVLILRDISQSPPGLGEYDEYDNPNNISTADRVNRLADQEERQKEDRVDHLASHGR
jgi:hypothetical protein